MHSAAGHFPHLADRVFFRGVDDVGGAEFTCQFQFAVDHVDGNNACRTGNGGTVNCGKSDSASTDNCHSGARLDRCRMDHRAYAGGHATADECCAVHRHIFADLNNGMFVYQHVFREG